MTSGRGGGDDPWELDPFAEDAYDPSLAFAHIAAKQAAEKLKDAEVLLARELTLQPAWGNPIAASARQSTAVQLEELRQLVAEAQRFEQVAHSTAGGSAEQRQAVDASVDAFQRSIAVYDELMTAFAKIGTPDPPPTPNQAVPLPPLQDAMLASQQIEQSLLTWLAAERGNHNGKLALAVATPGVGKTHAMLRAAYVEQQQKQRIIVAPRTKSMVTGETPEIVNRLHNMSPTGKVHLAVITGRDEDNCYEFTSVQAVQQHGYAPNQAVCLKCAHYPDNARTIGMRICPYYEDRIRAHNLSNGARVGQYNQYPIIVTTHASVMASFASGGGRWGSFWSADIILVDEDCTDSIENDTILSHEQTAFSSNLVENRAAHAASKLFATAIELGKKERSLAAADGFRAPGQDEYDTHPIHTSYDSAYTGAALHDLLQRTYRSLGNGAPAGLHQVLRDVAEGQSFQVGPGDLVGVTSVDDINAMHIPPRALAVVAENVHGEISHHLALRRIAYEKVHDRPPTGPTEIIVHDLTAKTKLVDTNYVCRLECLPADPQKNRLHDVWQFVVRTFAEFSNRKATVVVGDAYGQKEHYEQLFRRDVHVIQRLSQLQDSPIVRILSNECSIGRLRKGSLRQVLALVESLMPDDVHGKRVLIYGHEELRETVEAWMQNLAEQRGIAEWAYEHWWGGRGKDEYNGWEYTYCISDPIQSLSGILHVTNARAYRDATHAAAPTDKLDRSRKISLSTLRHGIIHALSSGDPRLAREHERVNIAELTQGMHRSRPVHHRTNITVIGEMEQSRDLLVQTRTVVPADYRKERVSRSRRKTKTAPQLVGTIDAFVSRAEVRQAIQAIIDWYGVFSPLFVHALMTTTVPPLLATEPDPSTGTLPNEPDTGGAENRTVTPEKPSNYRVDAVVIKDSLKDHGINSVIVDEFGAQLRNDFIVVPDVHGAPGTIVERVWHPSVYWQLWSGTRQWPKAIREELEALRQRSDVQHTQTSRWPVWQQKLNAVGGGRKPTIYFDPQTPFYDALELYYDIVDHQYGPVVDGRLHRPSARPDVPRPRWADMPF